MAGFVVYLPSSLLIALLLFTISYGYIIDNLLYFDFLPGLRRDLSDHGLQEVYIKRRFLQANKQQSYAYFKFIRSIS